MKNDVHQEGAAEKTLPPRTASAALLFSSRLEQTYVALLLLPHNALRTRLQPELAACRDAIAVVGDRTPEEIQNDFEARVQPAMIAAAPLLLTELKHCLWLLDDLQKEPGLIQEQARRAISAAVGDPSDNPTGTV